MRQLRADLGRAYRAHCLRPCARGWSAFELAVDGLHGGHSGRTSTGATANATTLLAPVLLALSQSGEMKLGPVKGGTFRLAIPRDGQSGGVYPPRSGSRTHRPGGSAAGDDAAGAVGHRGQDHRSGQPTQKPEWCSQPDRFLAALLLAPDGIYQMNETLVGLVDTSDNMGSAIWIRTGCAWSLRSAPPGTA